MLCRVANGPHDRPGLLHGGDEGGVLTVGEQGGFIDDEHGPGIKFVSSLIELVQEQGNGAGVDPG